MANEAEVFSRPNIVQIVEDVLKPGRGITEPRYSFPAVYCLKHIVTGKVYVGSTRNLARRISDHRGKLRGERHPNANIQKAFDEAPEFHLVYSQCDSKETALDSEQILLDQFGKLKAAELLNIATDARLSMKGVYASPETKNKMSETHKRICSDEKFRSEVSGRMKSAWASKEKREMYMGCVGLKAKPIVIDGIEYPNAKEAAAALNCHEATARRYARAQRLTSS